MRSRVIDKERGGQARIAGTSRPSTRTAADALRGASEERRALADGGPARRTREAGQRGGAGSAASRRGLPPAKPKLAVRIAPARGARRGVRASVPERSSSAVEDEIVGLAVELARHLVRREIEHDPARVARRGRGLPRPCSRPACAT